MPTRSPEPRTWGVGLSAAVEDVSVLACAPLAMMTLDAGGEEGLAGWLANGAAMKRGSWKDPANDAVGFLGVWPGASSFISRACG